MAHPGGGGGHPTLHNGYMPGHGTPGPSWNGYNTQSQVQHPRLPSAPIGHGVQSQSQYQLPTPSSAYEGQGQFWDHNAQSHHDQGKASPYSSIQGPHLQTPSPAPTRGQIPFQTQAYQSQSEPQPRPRPQSQHSLRTQALQSQTQPKSSVQSQFISPAQLLQKPAQTQHVPQYMSPQQIFHSGNVTSSSSTQMAIAPSNTENDIPNLLMSLAEEYFDAAHELAPAVAVSMTPENLNTYQKLIATGLGCLETALKNVRLSPRTEARIRLRYAGVLYDETDNSMEAETALVRGIALCERNHYFDIKYAMQYLLVRFLFKKSPKAGMKALDGHIADAMAYQHFSWVYALRFLRVSYALESDNPKDGNVAIQNLRAIATLSSQQKDVAIYITASLVEALAHLKANGPESSEQAQRALAAARTNQLEVDAQIPQLTGLAHILDVVYTIQQGNPKMMLEKLRDMNTTLDPAIKTQTWSSTNSSIAIPINRTKDNSQYVSPETRMVISIGADGRDNMMMCFLSKEDTFSLTYMLGGMVLMHRNPKDHGAQKFFEQGLTSLQNNISSSRSLPGILPDCISKIQWRGKIMCYYHCYLAFCAAGMMDWAGMETNLDRLRTAAKENGVGLKGPLDLLVVYLSGVCHQGRGNLDAALNGFRDPKFNLLHCESSSFSLEDRFMRDVSLLAALNTIWILQHSDRQDINVNTELVARLEGICERHPDTDVRTAFQLVLATVDVNPPAPLWKIKRYLGAALSGAQTTNNLQHLCITLNVMCNKFFANVIGDQAEKSAMAAAVQAERSGNILWRSVAEGLLSNYYDVNGKKEEAAKTLEKAHGMAKSAWPDYGDGTFV